MSLEDHEAQNKRCCIKQQQQPCTRLSIVTSHHDDDFWLFVSSFFWLDSIVGLAMMCSRGGQMVEMNISFVSETETLDGA
jgi:hypothetical protein